MPSEQREFDIVVYGATGFVGKLTAQYLADVGGPARIALAGRSLDKLAAVRDALPESAHGWPLLVADASTPATLDELAARAGVVVTTVGPYTKYGLPLVAACAKAGTDYADLTGETMFIRESIDRYHAQAAETGARIVHSCGFDSIPSDLTVYALYKRALQDGTGQLGDTTFVMREMVGGVSGGTVASMIEVFSEASANPAIRAAMNDPYTLSPDRAAEPELGPQSDTPWRRGREIAPELDGTWAGAFVMGAPNSRIVRRSNALLDWAYGRRLRYSETTSMGASFVAPVAAAASTAGTAAVMGLASRYLDKVPRGLLERIAPKPGTGPSEEARDNGRYRVETYTTTSTGARYRATMAQRGDFGYKATSVLLGECGLALAFDDEELSDLRGVLTPAASLGDTLLARLPAAGVTLDTVRLS